MTADKEMIWRPKKSLFANQDVPWWLIQVDDEFKLFILLLKHLEQGFSI